MKIWREPSVIGHYRKLSPDYFKIKAPGRHKKTITVNLKRLDQIRAKSPIIQGIGNQAFQAEII